MRDPDLTDLDEATQHMAFKTSSHLDPRRSRAGLAFALALALTSACAGGGPSTTATATEATAASETAATTSAGTDTASSTSSDTTALTDATTSTASTGPTTTTTDATATTCDAGCEPDLPPSPIACDPWAQDCPEGEKCNAWANDGGSSWNAYKCTPIDRDPDAVGEPCTVEEDGVSGVDSCVKGAMCFYVDHDTNTGVCVALCEGSEDVCSLDSSSCCPPGFKCSITGNGVLILCLATCDPIAQDCPSALDGCYPLGDAFECVADASGEMGAVGEPCEFTNVCDPGLFCGDPKTYPGCDPMAGGCCVPFCELDDPECVPGTECEPWYDPMDVPPGYENLGACVIPS